MNARFGRVEMRSKRSQRLGEPSMLESDRQRIGLVPIHIRKFPSHPRYPHQ